MPVRHKVSARNRKDLVAATMSDFHGIFRPPAQDSPDAHTCNQQTAQVPQLLDYIGYANIGVHGGEVFDALNPGLGVFKPGL